MQSDLDEGLQLQQEGRLGEAEAIYRRILANHPDNADALHLLGVLSHRLGRLVEAENLICQAISLRPEIVNYHCNLGIVLMERGRLDEAIDAFRRAIDIEPERAELAYNLGIALKSRGRLKQSIEAFRRAVELRPEFIEAHNNLGNALFARRQPADAIDAFRRALAIRPDFVEAWNNLATAQNSLGRLDDALQSLQQASALPHQNPAPESNRLNTIQFHPDFSASDILHEAMQWNRKHADRFREEIRPHDNDRSPDRRLRIGYISPDFRRHCQALFTTPLFANHDHANFEIFCYSDVINPDSVTARLMGYADHWRKITGMRDEKVANLIREDRIDILVDLTLHMAGNRLLVFARKPAPVQITWLGYPGTTGLETIDYRLTDPRLDPIPSTSSGQPEQNDAMYTERSIRLPETFWCYDADGMDIGILPDPGPVPALSKRFTFGSLNNFCKVTDQTLALWGKVLAAVPNSQFILLSPPGPHRQQVIQKLGLGSTPDRLQFVEFQPRQEYLKVYQQIDLGLDTIPYNGHTTSLDSFWMGVPVITRVGKTVVGRAGQSQSHNLDLPEFAATSDEQFVEIAVKWAADLDRLAELRATLRERMRNSPLTDAPRFANNLEAVYRHVWRIWCR